MAPGLGATPAAGSSIQCAHRVPQALWEALPVVERLQTAADAHKQAETCECEHGAYKQARRRVNAAEKTSIGSRWLRDVPADGSRSEDSSDCAV